MPRVGGCGASGVSCGRMGTLRAAVFCAIVD